MRYKQAIVALQALLKLTREKGPVFKSNSPQSSIIKNQFQRIQDSYPFNQFQNALIQKLYSFYADGIISDNEMFMIKDIVALLSKDLIIQNEKRKNIRQVTYTPTPFTIKDPVRHVNY